MFADNLKRYVVIKTAVSLATGVLVGLWLLVQGVDYALLWGTLAFLLNYIPGIGLIIAGVVVIQLFSSTVRG